MAEGQTATNPQTGQRVVLRGGQWVPMGAGPANPTGPAPGRAPQASTPRGLRNNNPGNIEDGAFARSLPGYAGSDGRFAKFDSADAGNQAAPRLLSSYISRGYNTPASIINRWAPPSDNNPTQKYAEYVARRAGVGVNDTVGADKIPLIAQAISEFENGNTVSGVSTPPSQQPPATPQTATNPQTGEKIQLVNGQWQPVTTGANETVVNTGGVRIKDGKTQIYDPAIDDYVDATPEQVSEYEAGLRRSQSDRQARVERQADPEYQAAIADARRGSANVPDALRALGMGASYGFLTDINAEAQRAIQSVENAGLRAMGKEVRYGADDLAQATRDAMRDDQAAYAAEKPIENFALQLAGGIAAPGAIQGGQFIGAAGSAGATGRAALVGGAMGAASGLGYGEGNLAERAPGAAIGAATGAGTGAIIQGGLNRLGRAGQGGGAARRLSRQGVDLTPGQMISEVPVVGEFARNIEDVAGGFNPLMMGVRRRQNEQMVRAAGNEALGYIGESLPKKTRTGYQVSQAVKRALGDRYDQVTSRISAQADPQIYTEIGDLTTRAAQTLDDANLRRLDRILNDKFINEFDAGGQLSGANFKRIETALREQSDRASRPTSTLADNDLAEFLDEARDIARGLIARQYPAEAETIQALNRGWATNKIIERAVTGSAGFSRSGTPTPGEISQAVVNSSNLGAIANENALLQGLATDARTVLPSTVPDSGTAQKTVFAAGVGALGAGGAAVLSPGLAPLIATGAVVYSRLGVAALNAVYRATDSQTANAALRQLADQARRNPSLLPYYEDAAQHVLGLSQRDTQAAPQAQPSAQAPSPALQRVLQ